MRKIVTLVAVLMAGTVGAQADFLVNANLDSTASSNTGSLFGSTLSGLAAGSFDIYKENGSTSAIPGWTAGPNGIEIQHNVVTTADTQPFYVELDTHGPTINQFFGFNSQMSQTLTSGSYTPGVYRLSIQYRSRPDRATWLSGDPMTGGHSTFAIGLYLNDPTRSGAPLKVFDDPTATTWTTMMTPEFNLASGDYTFTFAALGWADSFGGLIDTIRLTQVPEPATLVFVGVGLIGLYFVRRKRNV